MSETFNKKDASARFKKALVGALNTPPKPLAEIVSDSKSGRKKTAKKQRPRRSGA
jgi:hypothetical protein